MSNGVHFYLRDHGGHPIGVVAILPEESGRCWDATMGTSLCSRRDAWSRDIGVTIAYGRARHQRCALVRAGYCAMRVTWIHVGEDCSRLRDVDWPRAQRAFDRIMVRITARAREAAAE